MHTAAMAAVAVAALLTASQALTAAAAATAAPAASDEVATKATPPSFVFILADDMGYSEQNWMNNTKGISTPNLDALAEQGVALRNYYVQPICSPTRSALLTGRYPMRLGTQSNVIYWDTPWAIPLDNKFFSESLQDAGYKTALFGKWHLGMFADEYTPWNRGFEEHIGYLQGCGSAWTHVSACCTAGSPSSDERYVCPAPRKGPDYRGYDWFHNRGVPDEIVNGTNSVDLVREAAVKFIQSQDAEDPFFLFLPFQNIHAPYTTEEKYRAPYESRTDLTQEEMTMYGYISELDVAVGAVFDELVASRRTNNTVIVFSSDNGAPNADGVRGRNYPFRGFKTEIWEGGTRVPGLVHSPLLPASVRGTTSDEMFHITDWLPTILGLAGAKLPPKNKQGAGLDGHDIWESITTGGASPRSEILYNVNPLCEGGQAGPPKAGIRMDNWKLLAYCYSVKGIDNETATGPKTPKGGLPSSWPSKRGSPVVLFDLDSDPSETTDVSGENPDTVTQLLARLETLALEMVEPMQWTPPFQGPDWECASCPLRPKTGPNTPWTPWINSDDLVTAAR